MVTMGAVVTIEELFSNKQISFKINGSGVERSFALIANRRYVIPEYQREIRWEDANIKQLIKDVCSGEKFLGNIILAKCKKDKEDGGYTEYEIIDGQQRITIIYLIIKYLEQQYKGQISLLENCELTIENFLKFDDAINSGFGNVSKEIEKTDKLFQLKKYSALWKYICSDPVLNSKKEASSFIRNLKDCEINLILNTSLNKNIICFMDVNTKGKHLDDEDILKGYIFLNDSSDEIKKLWSNLKVKTSMLNESGVKYSFLTIIEQYLYCELYKNSQFDGVSFNQHFKITKTKAPAFYVEQHIIEALQDNAFIKTMLEKLGSYIDFCIDVVSSKGNSGSFSNQFNPAVKLDDNDYFVFHNFIKKVIMDTDEVPKVLILKYYLEILYDCHRKTKADYELLYSLYTLAFLFTIFVNKKSSEPMYDLISKNDWKNELIKEIKSYNEDKSFTDKKLQSRYRVILNLDGISYEYRAKTMATLYNFFELQDSGVVLKNGCGEKLKEYLTSSDFTTEHFLVNKSRTVQYHDNGKKSIKEKIPSGISKFYNSIFNFIFIKRDDNSSFENSAVGNKLEILEKAEIKCEYSKYYIDLLKKEFGNFPVINDTDSEVEIKNKIYDFYDDSFVEKYVKVSNLMYKQFFKKFIR